MLGSFRPIATNLDMKKEMHTSFQYRFKFRSRSAPDGLNACPVFPHNYHFLTFTLHVNGLVYTHGAVFAFGPLFRFDCRRIRELILQL